MSLWVPRIALWTLAALELACGSVLSQDATPATTPPAAAQAAPAQQKIPEYFGVFARMKDGSLVELERRDVLRGKWVFGEVVRGSDIGPAPWRDVTAGIPKVELDLAQVEHFLFHFETKGIHDENCALHHFHFIGTLRGEIFDVKDKPRDLFTDNSFVDLGAVHDSRAGLRTAKAGEDAYKVFFPDASKWKATADDINASKPGVKLPVAVLGLHHEKSVYQFRLKKPVPDGPKVSSFTLDLAKYAGKPPGFELGEALVIGERNKKPVIEGTEGGRFSPANLALTSDFTVTMDIGVLCIRDFCFTVASAQTSHTLSIVGRNFHFGDEDNPVPVKRMPGGEEQVFRLVFKRRGDTLTATCDGKPAGSAQLPASETVDQVTCAGFIQRTAIHSFTVTSP